MEIDLYYHPERNEYIFISDGNALRVDEEDFNHLKKSFNPLFYQMCKNKRTEK